MKVQQFLEHQGLSQNPFSQEDAQTDPLFKQFCAKDIFHPAWDKIFGDAGQPATSVVFGEKGSGKTAMRLQMVQQIAAHNLKHPNDRVYVIEYDDFNPFLDAFHSRMLPVARSPERTLSKWRLWDHMDAILSLGVTGLLNDLLSDNTSGEPGPNEIHSERLRKLSRSQQRDLLLLAALYDHSLGQSPSDRWSAARRRVGFANWKVWWDFLLGLSVSLVLFLILAQSGHLSEFGGFWPWLLILVAWAPWLWRQARLWWLSWRISHQIRVFEQPINLLRSMLARFESKDLIGQPMPSRDRSDDRYELLTKFQGILKTLGFSGVTVIVDRVDEPHLVNGSAERMRDLLWPMFDNKLLKHAGVGFKLLLPIEVSFYLAKEDKTFYEKSRLDKQHLVRSLEWTGESLYDLANDRIRAVSTSPSPKTLKHWFEDVITDAELISTLARLRVPRHLFKFLHRLLVEHCHRYTDDAPRWDIARETLHSTLAVYLRDLEAYDRGLGAG